MSTPDQSTIVDKETIELKKIIIGYVHHWKLFACVFLLSLIPAVLYLVYYPTTYEMMARIQLQEDKSMGSSSLGLGDAAGLMKSFGLGSAGGGVLNMDDELVKLLSNDLLKEMVIELGVNVNYLKPFQIKYYMYESVPIVLKADSVTNYSLNSSVSFDISINKEGKVKVVTEANKDKKTFEYTSLPADIQLKEGTFTLSYAKEPVTPFSLKVEVMPAGWVAEDLAETFVIEEYSKTSNVIEFVCQDYEKQRGLDMLNTLIALYNKQEEQLKKEEGNKSIQFLDGRIQSILSDLSDVELSIESYKTKNKMTDLEYDIQFYTEQMKELQTKIIELEAQSHVITFLDTYVKDPQNEYNLIPSLLSASDGEKGSPITIYNEALIERERVLQTSKTDNPLIGNLNKQIEQLRGSVFLSIDNAKRSVTLTLNDLKAKEKILLDKMGVVPSLEREYVDFKRQQEVYQAVYLILLQKREEIALSIGEDKNKARIIDAAFVKQSPVGPRKLFAVLGMLVMTLIVPVGYLFVKKQIVDLKAEYLKSKKEE